MQFPTPVSRRDLARGAVIAPLAAVIAACAGSDDDTAPAATATTLAPEPTDPPTTTPPPTDAPTTTLAPTTTTEAPQPVYPLTGLPVVDPAIAARGALVVKIDNAQGARPQTGFNAADMVVEEIVNDRLTRFAMVFQSGDSDPVGPIRSGRLQDIDLFSMLNRPLFAWSGGNRTVTDAIRASDLIDIGPNVINAYYRSNDRSVPHNLYSRTTELRAKAPVPTSAPQQIFDYRRADDTARGNTSSGVAVTLDSIDVLWTWDPTIGQYRREMEGRVHNDAATNSQVTTDNVVVLVVTYADGISGSPDAQTTGEGDVHVFAAGTHVAGRWARNDIRARFALTDADGEPILLSPGRTFIELPRPGNTLPLPPA